MGYQLYREIKNHAPEDWTAGERLVALVIADSANERTRRSKMPIYELMEQTGYSNRMICKCLDKLRDRGFEFRTSYGIRKDGQPIYTCRGRAVAYQVPHLVKDGTRVPPLPLEIPVDNPVNGGTPVPSSQPIGGTPVPPAGSNGGTRVHDWRHSGAAPYPQSPLSMAGVVRGSVEVSPAPRDVPAAPVEKPASMSAIEWAARQAAARQVAESRHMRGLAEREATAKPSPKEGDTPP